MSAAQVLDEAGAEKPALRSVAAISSYRVTVSLAGRSRSYRAAFLWLPAGATPGMTFVVVDHIVQNVEGAVVESVPAPRPSTPRRKYGIARDSDGLAPLVRLKDDALCQETAFQYQESKVASGDNDHFFGEHASSATFKMTCRCDMNCTQTCSIAMVGTSCVEQGMPISMCHVMRSDSSSSVATSFGSGHLVPADCAAGFGCVQAPCLFCVCGLSVTVSVVGISVTFGSSGDPEWTGNHTFSRTCPPCQTAPPAPSGNGGGGGGGIGPNEGGNGGNGGTCTCDCDHNGWVTKLECEMGCGGLPDGQYCWMPIS